jgi:hypothetical protein
MIKNKRGMSDIVVTLVIILLSLIAIGVVWVVVNNLLKSGTESVEITQKCSKVQLEVVAVSCTQAGLCNVTAKKTGTNDELAGVKLVFSNAAGNYSAAQDTAGDLTLAPKILGQYTTGITNATVVQVTPYFKDASNKVQDCTSQVASETFVSQ